MKAEELKRIVSKIDSIPTLPTVIDKLNQITRKPNVSANEVNEVISSDQALTAKILRLVNSAFYGFPGQIATVTHAVVILGFNAVRSLALSTFVFDMFSGIQKFDRRAFWEHSISVAVITRYLARRTEYKEEEEAFVSGLLHDIGKIVLDQYAPDDFDKIINRVKEKDILFFEAEREILSFNHQTIGEWLSEHWQLPSSLKTAITYHHRPHEARANYHMAALVHFADILARSKGFGSGGDNRIPPLNGEAWKILKLEISDLPKILDDIDKEISKAEMFFSMAK